MNIKSLRYEYERKPDGPIIFIVDVTDVFVVIQVKLISHARKYQAINQASYMLSLSVGVCRLEMNRQQKTS